MSILHSPQSIFNLGHRAIRDLFTVPVQIQEKVDGSFFAFGIFPESHLVEGNWVENPEFYELKIRSKRTVMAVAAPEALFKPAVKAVVDRQELLHKGWQYRGETLAKPNHNALTYSRTPKDNVILFDILTDGETYLPYEELKAEAERIGFEVVPQLYSGIVNDPTELRKFLDTESILGGQKIEGVVIKPLTPMFGQDKKMLFGKFVSEAFRETHRNTWGDANPNVGDITGQIGNQYATGARFQKGLMHLREEGRITDELRDIGLLIKEIPEDVRKECEDEIKDKLFAFAWPRIKRCITREVPSWYKEQLLKLSFEVAEKVSNETKPTV